MIEVELNKTKIKITTAKKQMQLLGGSSKDIAKTIFKDIDEKLSNEKK